MDATMRLFRQRDELLLPNVQDERAVLLGARVVTAMVVGSSALLGLLDCIGAISAVWASWPATGAPHATVHLVYSDFNAALAGGILLGRSNPADPFVAC
jgi:hypothetical protein